MEADTESETEAVLSYPAAARSGDIVVYQFATASAMAPWLASRGETLVVNYHNITPPELMAPWDNHLALGQLRAQGDLRLLAPRAALAIADSAYNEAHLAEAGFRSTAVVPPSAQLATVARTPATTATRAAGGGARWLAVGRVSPNKALESTVAALAVARVHHDPDATLRLVGKPATGSYGTALRRYVADLGLADAVTFSGHASDDTVAAAYAEADVLVVTSEHEGFCVPVVEAMSAGLPVVAFDRGAVPEVVGDAGILVSDKDPYALAASIDAVLADGARRDALGGGRGPPAGCLRPRHRGRPLPRPGGHAGGARRGDVSPAVHQFVPMLHRADAVGRHTLRLREVMAARGIASEIYVELVDPDTAADTRPVAAYADEAQPGDVLVYQFATASSMAPWLVGRTETLVVNHHNVTPPQYYAPWDNAMARHQLLAEQQLRDLAPRAALALAVSAFNEAELRAAGFARTAVVPPAAMLPGPAPVETRTASPAAGTPGAPGARWISVGRLAPNKGIEFELMALLVARAHEDPAATLEVVGRPVVPAYTSALSRFADELGLRGAVVFTGALARRRAGRPDRRAPTCSWSPRSTRASGSRCSRP